jgi:SAM-dependent methyltransferase
MTLRAACDLALPEYDRAWLERYDRLEPADAEITRTEMEAFWLLASAATATLDSREVSYLDLGTCTGRYLRWGCDQDFRTICGIDNSPASIRHCASLRRPGRVFLYRADFLNVLVMRELAARHGPFQLITAMLGTVDHVSRHRRASFLDLLSEILSPVGTLVLSSWQVGRCDLSLYSERERSYLGSTGFAELLGGECDLRPNRLQLVRTVLTPWHLLAAFTRRPPDCSQEVPLIGDSQRTPPLTQRLASPVPPGHLRIKALTESGALQPTRKPSRQILN